MTEDVGRTTELRTNLTYEEVTGLDQRGWFFFLREVNLLANRMLIAADDLDRSIESEDYNRAWYSIHNFLVAAANLSKLLWPSPPRWKSAERRDRYLRRGLALRAILGVPVQSPLRDRGSRDYLEHFDEWLTDWTADPAKASVADLFVGPVEDFKDVRPAEVFRHYDPATRVLTFRGATYELGPVIEAIRFLQQKAFVYLHEIPAGIRSPETLEGAIQAMKRAEAR